ncbi:hypothetical protein BMT55_06960 [Listeria newyorkensis]|uniref:Pesticidal crystal protein Cry22Aa Ig-like domain-containing protein n=1 Tax=Listeria newyorkensis TaxID=1497681 RepID=A0ABX4XNL9_9LIST|nr:MULTISPECIES: immunoglobulin-like domain-containing protein [Listeria]KGL42292.1 hypothetical protein EP56_08730 [Listeriaceae bacterium FSL A5-0209]KGL38722.1 hypothetical protein EP58_14905 [Listeria newyorkensis]KMT62245.1 putative peptidoglycan linked protein [Listeria newyorkensis]PNP92693.1 hypothetical protein BMT55_06960 [Listeria newyorkensis]RQW66492.1 DUF5011 domain-containing protein [Listeria sp. SHR_NRA_18]
MYKKMTTTALVTSALMLVLPASLAHHSAKAKTIPHKNKLAISGSDRIKGISLHAHRYFIEKHSDFDPMMPPISLTAYDDDNHTDLTNSIFVTENDVDTHKVGTYHVTYRAIAGDGRWKERRVEVNVVARPIIEAEDASITRGTFFDYWTNVSAFDELAGDIRIFLHVKSSDLNSDVPGKYFVTYTASNFYGLTTEKTIYVTVK